MRRLVLLLGLLIAAGCSHVPSMSSPDLSRTALQSFVVTGRFALKVERPGAPEQSGSGRLVWHHDIGRDRVMIANPLGVGVADLEIAGTARLVLADGTVRESADADALLRDTTGYALPVSRLAAWLLGRGRVVERDPLGRPLRLEEAGWQVDYVYPDETAEALPSRLTIVRDAALTLRLRIESWSESL